MLGNLSIKAKLITLVGVFLVTFIGINIFINVNLNSQGEKFKKMQQVVDIRGQVVGSLTTGLQITSALRGMYIDPSDKKTLGNLEKAVVKIGKHIQTLDSEKMRKLSKGMDKFNIKPLYTAYHNDLQKLIAMIKNNSLTDKAIITHIVNVWRPFKKSLKKWRGESKKKDELHAKIYKEGSQSIITLMMVLSVLGFVFIAILSYVIITSILGNMTKVQTGISSFFDFLNRKTSTAQRIALNTNDEFGKMAKDIDENISVIESSIKEDNAFISDAQSIMARVKNGRLSVHIEANSHNPNLKELKETINEALEALKERFVQVIPF
ncbi:MAG: hypothetical protein U9Q33_03580 [Campylobacterota bacterium]|nr:hypothetical protein [Campylobacterota bacterium]